MKAVKIIAVVLAVLLAGYAIFVAADSVRLRKASLAASAAPAKPLVTLSQEDLTEEGIHHVTYTGPGYAVTYEVSQWEDGQTHLDGAEFRLFGKLLVWAWIS